MNYAGYVYPAGVGLLESWPQLAPIGVPVSVITLVSTVIVMIFRKDYTVCDS